VRPFSYLVVPLPLDDCFASVDASILRRSSRSGFLPSLDDGESGARARLAFRISVEAAHRSVATSCRNKRSNHAPPITAPSLETFFSWCASTAPPRRLTQSTGRASAKPLSRPLPCRTEI